MENNMIINIEFTDTEKAFLIMLFNIGNEIIKTADDCYDINYVTFSHNDLFKLAEKLGIDYN